MSNMSFSNVIEDSEEEMILINECKKMFIKASSIEEIKNLNMEFIKGNMYATCYHYGPLNSESKLIIEELVKMNELGFITTGSQPGEDTNKSKQRGTINGLIERNKHDKFRKILNEICDEIYIKKVEDNNIIEQLNSLSKPLPEWYWVTYDNGSPFTHVSMCDYPCESFYKCNLWEKINKKYIEIEIIDMKWGRTNYIHKKVVETLEKLHH
jgi:hypothetical protein